MPRHCTTLNTTRKYIAHWAKAFQAWPFLDSFICHGCTHFEPAVAFLSFSLWCGQIVLTKVCKQVSKQSALCETERQGSCNSQPKNRRKETLANTVSLEKATSFNAFPFLSFVTRALGSVLLRESKLYYIGRRRKLTIFPPRASPCINVLLLAV